MQVLSKYIIQLTFIIVEIISHKYVQSLCFQLYKKKFFMTKYQKFSNFNGDPMVL